MKTAVVSRRHEILSWTPLDAAHYGRPSFVPEWYVVACVLVDLALGVLVSLRLLQWHRA